MSEIESLRTAEVSLSVSNEADFEQSLELALMENQYKQQQQQIESIYLHLADIQQSLLDVMTSPFGHEFDDFFSDCLIAGHNGEPAFARLLQPVRESSSLKA